MYLLYIFSTYVPSQLLACLDGLAIRGARLTPQASRPTTPMYVSVREKSGFSTTKITIERVLGTVNRGYFRFFLGGVFH